MLKVKTNTKILLILGIMLVAMFIFNINTVNAATETEVQQILDLIPDNMSLNISEMEYNKSDEVVRANIKTILENQKIEFQDSNSEFKIKSSTSDEYDIQMYVSSNSRLYLGLDNFRTADITIQGIGVNAKDKKINLEYNNFKNYNSNDETYVKNLKLESPKYYEVDLDYLVGLDEDATFDAKFNEFLELIRKHYTDLANDNSIDIIASSGASSTDGGLNLWNTHNGTCLGIFKKGILYDIREMGEEFTVPVINVPSTVTDSELNDYLKEVITKVNKTFGEKITKIEQGTKNKDELYGIDIDIPNGYTVYSDYGATSYIIVNKDKNTNDIVLTDKETNIKLEADENVVPSNTVLEVNPITEGTTFDNIKRLLSNVNKFRLFDITLKSNGVEIQPNGNVKISIPIPEDFDKSKLVVYRIEENGNKIEYAVNVVTIDGIKYAQFETDHFSKYVLAEVETNSNEKDNTPKTGTETNTMPYVLGIVATIGTAFIIKRK